jgi:DNA-binding NarL/FixJ family response regulator
MALARRLGDGDLESDALSFVGWCLVERGGRRGDGTTRRGCGRCGQRGGEESPGDRGHLAHHDEGALRAQLLALLAEAEAAAGRLDAAGATCASLDQLAGDTSTPLVRALAAYARGVICRVAGDEAATRHLEAALAGFATAGLPYEQARTRLELARAVVDTSPEVTLAEGRTALELFEQLSARPRCRCRREPATPARRTRPALALRRPGQLTKRESVVLHLLFEGLSNDQIAERLVISGLTAEHHVSSILGKLGLTSRSEAVAHAVRNLAGPPSRVDPHGVRHLPAPHVKDVCGRG